MSQNDVKLLQTNSAKVFVPLFQKGAGCGAEPRIVSPTNQTLKVKGNLFMKQYIPSPKNQRAKRIATALFVTSLLLFAVSGIRALPYRSVVQLFSFALMTAAIMVCVRYLFRSYTYRIEPCEDGFEFVVLESSRRGRAGDITTVCRLSMAALLSVEPWTDELAKEKRPQKNLKIYNYCVDVAPTDVYLLSFSDSTYAPSDTPICLKIQCDSEFKTTLEGFLKN
jgi:hypothetical protein